MTHEQRSSKPEGRKEGRGNHGEECCEKAKERDEEGLQKAQKHVSNHTEYTAVELAAAVVIWTAVLDFC